MPSKPHFFSVLKLNIYEQENHRGGRFPASPVILSVDVDRRSGLSFP